MKKMIKAANYLDKILHVTHILLTVAMVILAVGLCLIGGYFLFDLDPSMVGSDFDQVDFGILTLTVAGQYVPDLSKLFLIAAGEMVFVIVIGLVAQKLIRCFQGILAPMKEGAPFLDVVSRNLKKAAKIVIALGILTNAAALYEDMAGPMLYNLFDLMLSDKILAIRVQYTFDLSFLLTAAVIYLLSYVFAYGEQLQQLSDETL